MSLIMSAVKSFPDPTGCGRSALLHFSGAVCTNVVANVKVGEFLCDYMGLREGNCARNTS